MSKQIILLAFIYLCTTMPGMGQSLSTPLHHLKTYKANLAKLPQLAAPLPFSDLLLLDARFDTIKIGKLLGIL